MTNSLGQQIWTSSRDNIVRNGGINLEPKTFHPKSGFSSSTKPNNKPK